MSTTTLHSLIRHASTELGSTACQAGKHQWASDGGRSCPHDLTETCSQAVYRCVVCDSHDYGERGGPGHTDCERHCRYRFERELAIAKGRVDPLNLFWRESLAYSSRRYHHAVLRGLRNQPRPALP